MRTFSVFILTIGLLFFLEGKAAEQWQSVRSGHFTILVQGSSAEALTWAEELRQFQRGLQRIIPVDERRLRPVTVVLFKSDRAFRPFKPLEKGKPQNVAGVFARLEDSRAIGLALNSSPDEIRRVIYHEAVHWHTSAADKALPPWLEEGLAEVYSTFQKRPDARYGFGKPMLDHLQFVRTRSRLSLEKLTATPRGSVSYNEGNRATAFYAESWAFVHYLLFGEDTPGMQSVVAYLQAMEQTKSYAEAFQVAFGADYEVMDKKLTTYLKGGRYRLEAYTLPLSRSAETPLKVEAAQAGRVEHALGILLAGADRLDEAKAYLTRAAMAAPDRPEIWQTLAEIALHEKANLEAADMFERAERAGSDSYFTYYGLGVVRSQLAAGPTNAAGNADEARYAAANFRRAIDLNPLFAPAYEALAGTLSGVDKLDPKDRERLESARLLLPDSARLDIGLSVCDFREGNRKAARNRLEIVIAEGKAEPAILELARALLKDDDWNQFTQHVDKMFKERKYAEVVTTIDAERGKFLDARYRQNLTLNRALAENYRQISIAVDLINARDFPEARALLEPLAENADSSTRKEAVRLLKVISDAGR